MIVSQGDLQATGVQDGTGTLRVEGKNNTLLYEVQSTHQSTTTTRTQTGLSAAFDPLNVGMSFADSDKTTFDQTASSTALATRLISTQKIEIGVGNKAELRGTLAQAPEIVFQKTDPSKTGELILAGSINTTQTAHTEKTETAGMWQEMKGHGSTTQTLNQTQLQGNLTFDAALKITAQIPDTKGGEQLKSQINALAASNPAGLQYLNQLAANPNVKWDKIALAHENWRYEQAGLTPAGAAVLTAVVAYFTAGAGATLTGTVGTATGAAMSAGFTALASSAAITMANNGGDISKTLEQLGREDSIKNIAMAMVTAGALDKLNTAAGWSNVNAQSDFSKLLLKNATNNLASSAMDAAINGKPWDEDALSSALTNALITTGMNKGANAIGNAASSSVDANGNRIAPQINAFTQKLAHAVLGCAAGSATAGNQSGCAPGAVGAVVGEMAADYYMSNNQNPALSLAENKANALAFARVISAVSGVVSVGGGDNAAAVNIAATAGANAAENNRMLHQEEYDRARLLSKNKQVLDELSKREGRAIGVDELEGRIVAEIQRNVDKTTSQQAGGVHDYNLRAVIGQNLNCNGYKNDPHYANPTYNTQYIAPNSNSYAKGLSFGQAGMTYNQLVTKNVTENPASTVIAGGALTATGVAVAGPAAFWARVIAGGIGTTANAGIQALGDQSFDLLDASIAGVTGFVTGGASNWVQGLTAATSINAGGALTGSAIKRENPNAAMGGAVAGTLIGYPIGKVIEKPIDKIFNPWYRPEWISAGSFGIVKPNPPSVVPGAAGGVASSGFQESSGNPVKEAITQKQGK